MTKELKTEKKERINMEQGQIIQIDSFMGGTYTAKIKKIENDVITIRITNKDHEHTQVLTKDRLMEVIK